MSELHLVRHGQASAQAEDYDRLSPLGGEQSRALGNYWAARGLRFDRVLVGPRRRHRQTLEAVAAAYRSRGLPWPEAEPLAALDEHSGPELFEHFRERLMPAASGDDSEKLRRYLRAYQDASRQWARGELETPPHLESWPAFRRRVADGLAEIAEDGTSGARVAAFTSGGAVAAAAGHALELGDEKLIELSWRVRNAAVTELLFSRRGFALHTFNATPHLEPGFLTYI
ncbi:MAG: histidine phosphatase family protein [Thermoanaerobaculia bacterium]